MDEAIKERYAELRKQVQDQLKDDDPEDNATSRARRCRLGCPTRFEPSRFSRLR